MGRAPNPAVMTAIELRRILDAAGMNQTAAAKLLGVNQTTVCRWLSGMAPISEEKAGLIRERIENASR